MVFLGNCSAKSSKNKKDRHVSPVAITDGQSGDIWGQIEQEKRPWFSRKKDFLTSGEWVSRLSEVCKLEP